MVGTLWGVYIHNRILLAHGVVLRHQIGGLLSGGYIYMYVFPPRDGGGGWGWLERAGEPGSVGRSVNLVPSPHLRRGAVAECGTRGRVARFGGRGASA